MRNAISSHSLPESCSGEIVTVAPEGNPFMISGYFYCNEVSNYSHVNAQLITYLY
jgi:hypothetical protein